MNEVVTFISNIAIFREKVFYKEYLKKKTCIGLPSKWLCVAFTLMSYINLTSDTSQ